MAYTHFVHVAYSEELLVLEQHDLHVRIGPSVTLTDLEAFMKSCIACLDEAKVGTPKLLITDPFKGAINFMNGIIDVQQYL